MRFLPPQVSRLLALAALLVVAYAVARIFLVPASFGKFGWYRGNALAELRNIPVSFAGRETCGDCHDDVVKKKAGSMHQPIGCEACHGANAKHAEDPDNPPEKIADPRFCLRCHEANPSRPKQFPQIDPSKHYAEKPKCMDCHPPHAPEEVTSK